MHCKIYVNFFRFAVNNQRTTAAMKVKPYTDIL